MSIENAKFEGYATQGEDRVIMSKNFKSTDLGHSPYCVLLITIL